MRNVFLGFCIPHLQGGHVPVDASCFSPSTRPNKGYRFRKVNLRHKSLSGRLSVDTKIITRSVGTTNTFNPALEQKQVKLSVLIYHKRIWAHPLLFISITLCQLCWQKLCNHTINPTINWKTNCVIPGSLWWAVRTHLMFGENCSLFLCSLKPFTRVNCSLNQSRSF